MIGAFSRLPPGLRKVRESRFSHVVISDVAAFYQYVDHELLRSELDLIDAPIRAADALLDLLGELHQRTFGLSQRSEPSDWLSEIYATRIDRWLLRRGLEHWRHNDDFRVGCETYGDALRAIEVLAAASRDSGLVLNDEKTAVPRFLTYVMNHSNVDVNATSDEIDPSDVEAAVTTEYAPDEDDQGRDDSREVVDRLFVPGYSSPRATPPIDLTELSHDHHRAVRRAINTLTRLEDDHAVPVLLDLLAYQPAMTHLVVRYAQTVAAVRPDVVDVLDSAMTKLSLTDWQRAWIAYGYRACDAEIPENRREWLTTLVARDPSSYSAAEAAVTLARIGSIEYALVEDQIRRAPTALVPWYLVAAKELKAKGTATQAAIAALQAVSPTARSLLS
jgi:hypothetical protein